MVLITGAGGLIGYSVSNFFLKKNYRVFGIENDKRKFFFGKSGSIKQNILNLKKNKNFEHFNIDVTNNEKIKKIFQKKKI